MPADRDFLFEKFVDNLELYLAYKDDYTKKMRAVFAKGGADVFEQHWQERDTLDSLRQVTRRALDEYVLSGLTGAPLDKDTKRG